MECNIRLAVICGQTESITIINTAITISSIKALPKEVTIEGTISKVVLSIESTEPKRLALIFWKLAVKLTIEAFIISLFSLSA
jgi:hypothetical protein